jgi:hypothetical protein
VDGGTAHRQADAACASGKRLGAASGVQTQRMNREQRRHPEKADQQPGRPPAETPPHAPEEDMLADGRQQDDLSVRAKNSGHGKKTADKWNQ